METARPLVKAIRPIRSLMRKRSYSGAEPREEAEAETYVFRIAADQAYRPALYSLNAIRGFYIERLVKSGVNRCLERSEHIVLKILLTLIYQKHWKPTGELFAFPRNRVLEKLAGCGRKYSYKIVASLREKRLVCEAEREIDGQLRPGYLICWPPEEDSAEWKELVKKKRRKTAEPTGPFLPFGENQKGISQDTSGISQHTARCLPAHREVSPSTPLHNNERARPVLSETDRSKRIELTHTAAAAPFEPAEAIASPAADAAEVCAAQAEDEDAQQMRDLMHARELPHAMIRQLLSLPSTTLRVVLAADFATDQAEENLNNPTGFFISRIQDPSLLEEDDWCAADAELADQDLDDGQLVARDPEQRMGDRIESVAGPAKKQRDTKGKFTRAHVRPDPAVEAARGLPEHEQELPTDSTLNARNGSFRRGGGQEETK